MADYQRPVWLYKFELSPGKWIFVPDEATKQYGRELVARILGLWKPPRYYVHLGPQGHVRALRTHLNSKYFARVDIEGFYNSIRKSRVTRNLKDLFGSYEEARAVAVMSTVPNPISDSDQASAFVLPFGFVQSPILAALCLFHSKLGTALRRLPRCISRCVYVDDILLSTGRTREELVVAYEIVCTALQASGFKLHAGKAVAPSEAIQVFNIDIANRHLEVSAKRLDEFRATLKGTDNEYIIEGILSYVRSVSPAQEQELRGELL